MSHQKYTKYHNPSDLLHYYTQKNGIRHQGETTAADWQFDTTWRQIPFIIG